MARGVAGAGRAVAGVAPGAAGRALRDQMDVAGAVAMECTSDRSVLPEDAARFVVFDFTEVKADGRQIKKLVLIKWCAGGWGGGGRGWGTGELCESGGADAVV
jgi:hypothetical protein